MGDSQAVDGLFPEKVLFAHQASDAFASTLLCRCQCAVPMPM